MHTNNVHVHQNTLSVFKYYTLPRDKNEVVYDRDSDWTALRKREDLRWQQLTVLRETTHILVDAGNCIISLCPLTSAMGAGVRLHPGLKLTGSVKPPQTNTDTFTHVVTFRSSPLPPQTAPAEIKVSAVTAAPTLLLHWVTKITDGFFWKVPHNRKKCTRYTTTRKSTAAKWINNSR